MADVEMTGQRGSLREAYPLARVGRVWEESWPGVGDAAVRRVEVLDPLLESLDPSVLARVQAEERRFAGLAQRRRRERRWHRLPGLAYDESGAVTDSPVRGWGDSHPEEGTKGIFRHYMGAAYAAWHSLVPSAEALAVLSGPHGTQTIRDRRTGEQVELDEELRGWFVACSDAVGIRARAAVLAHIVGSVCGQRRGEFEWLSVACGTALPVFQAAAELGEAFAARVTLLDLDEGALATAAQLHGRFGLAGSVSMAAGNIFDPGFLGRYRADVVDAMGIFEYIGDPLVQMQAGLGVTTGPEVFLRGCYEAARDRVVFAQMLPDRPNADFTMGVIGWPYVEMRSVAEVVAIVDAAGIPTSQVTVWLPASDPVYAVYEIVRAP